MDKYPLDGTPVTIRIDNQATQEYCTEFEVGGVYSTVQQAARALAKEVTNNPRVTIETRLPRDEPGFTFSIRTN